MGEQLGLLSVVLEYRYAKHALPFRRTDSRYPAADIRRDGKPAVPTFRTADYTTRDGLE